MANNVPIEAGRFYTVRVEVKNALVKGFIDGKMIVQGKLNMPDETKVEQQPHIYTWASKIAVDKVKTEMEVEVQNIDADKVWDKVFAGRTKAQVTKQIEDLVEMLADEDAAVRDSATDMLKRIGSLAAPAVKEATSSGIMEQASRAKDILRVIQPG